MKIVPCPPQPITVRDFLEIYHASTTKPAQDPTNPHTLPIFTPFADGFTVIGFRDDLGGIAPAGYWAIARGATVLAFGWCPAKDEPREIATILKLLRSFHAATQPHQPS